jgi:acetyl esterase/lipase
VVRRGEDPAVGVEVRFDVSDDGGTISRTSVTTDATGTASPGEWVLGTHPGIQTLTASSPSVPGHSVTFTAEAEPADPSRLVFTVPPSLSAADRPITPAIEVRVTDEFGNPVASSAPIAIAKAAGSGTLSGTLTVPAVDGLARFSDLRLTTAGTGYRLVVSGQGLASATSEPFDIVAGGAAAMAIFAGNAQTGEVGAALPVPPAVKLLDAGGNPVGGAAVAFAAGNGGSVAGATALTGADGVARAGNWTLGPTAGDQSLTATATGYPVAPTTFSATGIAGPASAARSSVEVSPSSIAAGTGTATLRVTVRDAYGNPVSGAAVTLSASGADNQLQQPPLSSNGIAQGTLRSTRAEVKTIRASIGADAIPGSASLTVTPGQLASITIGPTPRVSVDAGQTVQLDARGNDAYGNQVTPSSISWASSNGAVASVSAAGLVTGKAPISTTVSATASGITASALVAVYGRADVYNRPFCQPAPGDTTLKLDVFLPDASFPRPRPVAIWIHGGAWSSGTSRDGESTPSVLSELKQKLRSRGYVFASLNYRKAPKHKWPAQGQDVRCAVRHLRHHDFSLGIDEAKVYVVGGSAGAHLAAFLGTGAPAGFTDIPEYLDQSSSVAAVAGLAGVYSLLHPSQVPAVPENDQVFPGWPTDSTSAYIRGASPLAQVSPDDAPFLLFHGELDGSVYPVQSQDMNSALAGVSVSTALVVVRDADHGLQPVAPATVTQPRLLEASPGSGEPITEAIADFFDARSGGSAAIASFNRSASESSLQIPAQSPHPRAVQGRFAKPF